MSAISKAIVNHVENAEFSSDLPLRRSDKALEAHLSLDPAKRPALYQCESLQILFPDSAKAEELSRKADRLASVEQDPVGAIKLLEDAIRLDYIAALDGDCLVRRAVLYADLGRHEPCRALRLYDIGCSLSRLRKWQEAEAVYDFAIGLDPAFVWPANNVAWMLATSVAAGAHRGSKAVAAAEWACANSGWGNWCFIGTLAAAFARGEDFERATAWQRVSLSLAPDHEKNDAIAQLHEFESGRPFVDVDRDVVAGEKPSEAELSRLNVQDLLLEANELITARSPSIH